MGNRLFREKWGDTAFGRKFEWVRRQNCFAKYPDQEWQPGASGIGGGGMRYVVSQRLAPKAGGGRHLLTEIMGNNLRTKEAVALGEGEHRNFYEIIEASAQYGWMSFDQSILNAYQNDLITEDTARLYATRKGTVTRGIDLIQKGRGVDSHVDSGLRMDTPENAFR